MPKKGSSGGRNWSSAFSPRKSHPRPRLFQEDRRTLQNILVDSVKDYKYKRNEMFKRMKVTTFVQMILHIAEFGFREELPTLSETDTPFRPDTADLEVQKIQNDGRSNKGGGDSPGSKASPDKDGLLQRLGGQPDSSTHSGTRGLVSTHTCPYLLLDIRDRDDFTHIQRNQEGKIIILYDNEEGEQTARAATTLVERGYDNLFLLTGGLKEAYTMFPKGLITGTVPTSFTHGEGPGVKVGKIKATSQPPTAREGAGRSSDFTDDDLDCLHMYLDNALRDNSSGSRLTQQPRGSAGRTCTRLTSLSSSSSSSTTGTGRQPFKP
ncbi:hypothetical protein ACOMHN_036294 [Nucella lapillus]